MPVDKSYTHFQSAIYIAKEIHICIKNPSCYVDGWLKVCIAFVYSHVCNYLLCAHMYAYMYIYTSKIEVLSYMPVDKHYTHFQSAIYIVKQIHICIRNHSCYLDGNLKVCIAFVDSHVCNYLLFHRCMYAHTYIPAKWRYSHTCP